MFVNVLKSDRSVEEAAPERDVRYVVVSTNVTPEVFVRSRPAVVVDSVRNPRDRFVVEAVMNDPYVVDDRENLFTPEKKLVSDSNVDEANDHVDVENEYTVPFVPTPRAPPVSDDRFNVPMLAVVAEAIANDE